MDMRLLGGAVAIVFLWAGAGAPAGAQTHEQLVSCDEPADRAASLDLKISGCTAAIQSGKFTGEKLALIFYKRGGAYYLKDDYDRAIADFNEVIRLDPTFTSGAAFFTRATIYAFKEDYDRAISDYSEAIRLGPKYAPSFYNRGNVYFHKEDYDRALSDYSEAIRLDPKHAPSFYNRGVLWEKKANFDRAIADYTEANRLDPSDRDVIAKLKKLKGQDPEVIR
jgi:tetratricopeptide (TPR) repeat protein